MANEDPIELPTDAPFREDRFSWKEGDIEIETPPSEEPPQ